MLDIIAARPPQMDEAWNYADGRSWWTEWRRIGFLRDWLLSSGSAEWNPSFIW